MKFFKESAAFRFGIRSLVVAAITFFISTLAANGGVIVDWASFLWGLGGAVAYALLGLLTPIEPFVGVKPNDVEVPVPPATRED